MLAWSSARRCCATIVGRPVSDTIPREPVRPIAWPVLMYNPLHYRKTPPEFIRLAVMMCIRFPLSLRKVEDLLHERVVDITHETVKFWWNRFGPLIAQSV